MKSLNQKLLESYRTLGKIQEEVLSHKDDDKPLTLTTNINYL